MGPNQLLHPKRGREAFVDQTSSELRGMQEAILIKFPNQTSVLLVNCVSCHGTKYCAGMVLAHGCTAGLTDFVQIHQIVIIENVVRFMVKTRVAWYDEHHINGDLDPDDLTHHALKIVTEGGSADGSPLEAGIVLEGVQVIAGLQSVPNACVVLVGLMYAVNLSYPKPLRTPQDNHRAASEESTLKHLAQLFVNKTTTKKSHLEVLLM
ncbi:hypothetical protein NFI96_009805 [Prochilodus magdalenae]|nr:hypothetical protein NFI96_009805 [Prochilodus magdalenae]